MSNVRTRNERMKFALKWFEGKSNFLNEDLVRFYPMAKRKSIKARKNGRNSRQERKTTKSKWAKRRSGQSVVLCNIFSLFQLDDLLTLRPVHVVKTLRVISTAFIPGWWVTRTVWCNVWRNVWRNVWICHIFLQKGTIWNKVGKTLMLWLEKY